MSIAVSDLLKLTFSSLTSNPLRSALTTLGVFMGVTAVSATLQVGNISRAVITERLAKREAPQVTLFPQWIPGPADRIRLQLQDIDYLHQRLKGIQSISGVRWAGSAQVLFQDRESYPSLMAVTQGFLQTSGKQLIAGRFFSEIDFVNYRSVVIIDDVLAKTLFQNQNPIGERLYVDRHPMVIIGLFKVQSDEEEDGPNRGQLFVPMAFFSALTGNREIGSIRIRPYRVDDLESLADEAESLLSRRFPGQRFFTWNNVEDILEQRAVLQLTARSLAAVGAISLLVGGIGIANIMIASVTERTSEIGVRRAIGATRREIMLQFILEATFLSLLGGIVAIAIVHGLTLVVADIFKLPYQFDVVSTCIALNSALLVGIGASFLPALQASQLDPVKALRSN